MQKLILCVFCFLCPSGQKSWKLNGWWGLIMWPSCSHPTFSPLKCTTVAKKVCCCALSFWICMIPHFSYNVCSYILAVCIQCRFFVISNWGWFGWIVVVNSGHYCSLLEVTDKSRSTTSVTKLLQELEVNRVVSLVYFNSKNDSICLRSDALQDRCTI